MSNPGIDKFTIACPQCGEIVAVSRAHVGKKGRCSICHTVFPIAAPDGVVHRPVGAAISQEICAATHSMWDEANVSPAAAPLQAPSANAPMSSLADEYLKRARSDKGGTIAEEENDATYRFVTSYGSVIGGIGTIVFGLFLALVFLFLLGSMRLTVVAILMIAGGIGWLVQGMNYVTYYRWKDRGGRD